MNLSKTKPYFLYVGNAYPHKNLAKAIEAVVQLNEEVKFVIISSRNIFVERLQKLVDKNKWQDKVVLPGFVPDEDLGSWYRNSLGFVFPSLSEGFGLPGLEAIAAGTICICSDIPVFKEIYQDKVLYFDPQSVSSIKEALQKVLEMKTEIRNKMIADGKEFVKRYSWATMAKQTLEVYESCK